MSTNRSSDLLLDMLHHMQQEALPHRMLRPAIETLTGLMRAEGAALISHSAEILYQAGKGMEQIHALAAALLQEGDDRAAREASGVDGRILLLCRVPARFGDITELVFWRERFAPWGQNDHLLARASAAVFGLILDHQAIINELTIQSRTDHLTGLLNRRAFHEELARHIGRLEQEQATGALMIADLDAFHTVNDKFGLEIGDRILKRVAQVLRAAVRPTDCVARFRADVFALWMNGADHFTAAERAESLRIQMPELLSETVGSVPLKLTVSMGIATRPFGSDAEAQDLVRTAELALQHVKRHAPGHWRVAEYNTT